MQTVQQQLQALYVTWQEPTSREYFPVGRLVGGLAPDQPNYEFCYLFGVKRAQQAGFQLFPSFPDANRAYRSTELFPMFQNRVMSSSRPEYRRYVTNLALNPDTDDPLTILMRSGGGRTTDSIEIFEVPRLRLEVYPYCVHFLAHGLGSLPTESLARIARLQPDERLRIDDCQHSAGRPALALMTEDGIAVGNIPSYLVGDAINLQNWCQIVECFAARVNPPNEPIQQRLLCRLVASCWPPEFRPYSGEDYQPIPADATNLSHWSQWPQG
ncbi:MAG: DNA-binding protein [Tepidisphaeraceae bacterium]